MRKPDGSRVASNFARFTCNRSKITLPGVVEDDRARISTIDLRIDYLRPARLETIVAEANVVRLGNRVGVADVRLYHGSTASETVATGKGVYNVTIKKEKVG